MISGTVRSSQASSHGPDVASYFLESPLSISGHLAATFLARVRGICLRVSARS
jgi:hypothetical protein